MTSEFLHFLLGVFFGFFFVCLLFAVKRMCDLWR